MEALTKTLGPVIVAFWIAWQYYQAQADKRVEATLTYVTRFESSDKSVGIAQRALTDALWSHVDEILELRTTRATEKDMADVRSTIIRRVVDTARQIARPAPTAKLGEATIRPALIGPLEELDDFFSALVTCVQGNVCDKESALRFFGCSANEYVRNFEPALQTRVAVAPKFGWGAKWIAENAVQKGYCKG